MKFLSQDIWAQITAAAKAEANDALVAVAYFGEKGDLLLPLRKGSSLVVDASVATVSQGGTCPAALLRLLNRGVAIYSAQNLHAKVFAFRTLVFVGSTNASTNSQKYLLEAVMRASNKRLVAQARRFVAELAITRLEVEDLTQLQKSYRPPRHKKYVAKQSATSTLIMELTNEQGIGRITQVQPPRPVWETYFEIDFDNGPYPTFALSNRRNLTAGPVQAKVVKHDHNLTVEIAGAKMPRPAILEIRKVGPRQYEYMVHRPPSKGFRELQELLAKAQNPLWTPGRKWLIV